MMKSLILKEKLFGIVSTLYILYLIFPLFVDITNIPILIPSLLTSVFLIFLYPRAFINKPTLWFLVYILVLFIYVSLGKPLGQLGIGSIEGVKKILIECGFILPNLAIFNILFYTKDYKLFTLLFKSIIILLVTSFLVILPFMAEAKGILRNSLSDETIPIIGVPGYTLMHAYVFSVTPILYGLKCLTGRQRIIWMFVILLLFYVILQTYVTTSLLVICLILFFITIYRKNKGIETVSGLSIAILLVFLAYESGLVLNIFKSLYPYFEETDVGPKINDFITSIQLEKITGGTLTARSGLHQISINTFLNHPLFGFPEVGSHSSFFDRLGALGLMGTLPFTMIFISLMQMVVKQLITQESRYYYYLSMASVSVFLIMKGLFGCEGWLFTVVIIPVIMVYFTYYSTSRIKKKI